MGKHEFRVTNLVATINVLTRRENDGEIAALMVPKNWTAKSAADLKTAGATHRHVSSQQWNVQLQSAGEWTNVSNEGAWIQCAGTGLEKETHVSATVRGNVHFR